MVIVKCTPKKSYKTKYLAIYQQNTSISDERRDKRFH